MKQLLAAFTMALLGGCALPHTGVRIGSIRPTLAVHGAPESSVLYLDGIRVGLAAQFDGTAQVLTVEEGPHEIEVKINRTSVYSTKIVVSSGESRVIDVGQGVKR
jgi:hypothetical protein